MPIIIIYLYMTPTALNGFPFTILTDLSCPSCYIYNHIYIDGTGVALPYVPITKFLERG